MTKFGVRENVSTINEISMNSDIKPFLDDIAERLWSGHAAIMVGSGFSKNADPINVSRNTFPSWSELADEFFEKVNGVKPGEKDRYQNALKLADEVSAAYGRNTLDRIIKTKIDDEGHIPNLLFYKLLELNWSDVFTTNYDTLLERARDGLQDRYYELVVRKEDLVNSKPPRIIKLHGSFPSHTPFIISEEDYRTYPQEYAPFVNTVQQALLEKSLCLVGFSGDDPNFLHWIGWIRDNFRDKTPLKIYLVGIIGLSESQRKLLERRHIIIIDMSKIPSVDGDHYKAFDAFFDYLKSRKRKENFLDWPEAEVSIEYPSSIDEDPSVLAKNVVEVWSKTRKEYPGWRVLPKDGRDLLLSKTNRWEKFFERISDLDDLLAFQFLYEFIWRSDRCLSVIWDDIASEIPAILFKNWPLPLSDSEGISFPENMKISESSCADISEKWLYIAISLLRYYREEGKYKDWEELRVIIRKMGDQFANAKRDALAYEDALQFLFSLDISSLNKHLNYWIPKSTGSYWSVKRAMLIAEVGDISTAVSLLESSLVEVRKKQTVHSSDVGYSVLSDESYILLLLSYAKSSLQVLENTFDFKETRTPSDRRNFLYQFKCDPWKEFEYLEIHLKMMSSEKSKEISNYAFDLNHRKGSSISLGYIDVNALKAFEYLRLSEDVAFPFRLPGSSFFAKATTGAISTLSTISPHWMLVTLLRSGNKENVDIIFSRKAISRLSVSQVDELVNIYVNSLVRYRTEIESFSIRDYRKGFAASLGGVLPEILSRLVVKASSISLFSVFDFCIDILTRKKELCYTNVDKLIRRLFSCIDENALFSRIGSIFEIMPPDDYDEYHRHFILPILKYTDIDIDRIDPKIRPVIEEDVIENHMENLISDNYYIRNWSLVSLYYMQKYGLLDERMTMNFVEKSWSRLDENGFPEGDLHYGYWCGLPAPFGVDVPKKVEQFLMSGSIVHQARQDNPKAYTMTMGNIRFLNEILVSNDSMTLSKDFLVKITDSLFEWWSDDKKFVEIHQSDSAFHRELIARFDNIVVLVAYVITNSQNSDHNIREKLNDLIDEMASSGMCCLRAKAALYEFGFFDVLIQEVKEGLQSIDLRIFNDAASALCLLVKNKSINSTIDMLVSTLVNSIIWRSSNSSSALLTINKILCDDMSIYTDDIEEELLSVFKFILTPVNYDHLEEDKINRDLFERKCCIRLCYTVYKKHYVAKSLTVPSVISGLGEALINMEEFNDVSIEWNVVN